MTKLFVLGATGYIGGDALYAIANAHPDYEITALVRDSNKGAKVAKDYPRVKLVYGDFDSADVIEKAAEEADIVLNCGNADHEGLTRAIIKGLTRHQSQERGFLIHTSGTGILTFTDRDANTFGEALSDKIYDDLENVGEVTESLPDDASHRGIDKLVLAAGRSGSIHTAIVCPPAIYGLGRGPDNQRSIQLPTLCKATLQRGQGLQVNAGQAYWNTVHVHDLAALYRLLVETAAAGGSTAEWPGKPATWGADGYYFAENGEVIWGEVSRAVADTAHRLGYLSTNEVKSLTTDESRNVDGMKGHILWGANSRGRAKRSREVLKWEPNGASLMDEIKDTLEAEATALGLKRGHAAVAAG